MIRIAMWSGPRNISTAMMRSWESRTDTFVIDEPFYAHYLSVTNANHPGRDEIIQDGETDQSIVSKGLISDTDDSCSIYFQKHMTHHMIPSVDREWMKDVVNCFLIRDPKDMILSYIKVNSNLSMHLLGLEEQYELFEYVTKINGRAPPVVDSKDILMDPRKTLSLLCEKVGVIFSEEMLSWSKGVRDTDGIWAKYWYKNVINSTGFNIYKEKDDDVPSKYLGLYNECIKIYKELAKYKIT
ncbi:HAD family hydrolase [bacterium]|nr:HAD family hydrolase [bacterium]